jgi:hypothetical protein
MDGGECSNCVSMPGETVIIYQLIYLIVVTDSYACTIAATVQLL